MTDVNVMVDARFRDLSQNETVHFAGLFGFAGFTLFEVSFFAFVFVTNSTP